jgi:hypothetical protein
MLCLLEFFCLITVGTTLYLITLPTLQTDAKNILWFSIFVEALYALAIGGTIILRVRASTFGGIASTALNLILLVFVPFGTLVGLYGLLVMARKNVPPKPQNQHDP